MSCPPNGIVFNGSQCSCPVGNLLNRTANRCVLFSADSTIATDSGVDYYAISFPETIFEFDSIKKFTQSQAVFLEATLVLLVSWLGFCLFLRLMKPGNDGRSIWFRLRWWVSRLDICFATRHWLDDQKVVKKRKTELGGTFSIASWIVFIGLFAALLYQIISRRSIEVHNVRATNAPDLASFINDMEFNITTISSMSCSNLRDLGTLVTGNPGFIDYRVVSLSNFGNYSCQNTSEGPTIILKCDGCQPIQDNLYISWQFVDLPNNPATAVGFQFNLTTRNHFNKRHVSFVSGILKNGSTFDNRPVTFRGRNTNILKFSLFPRIYRNLKDLRLIQPLFHEFVPGSHFYDTRQLQTSLASSTDGILNTTLYVNFLSSYIVEIDDQNIMGPVSFLADLGGLYCISIGIFFYLLVQCEYRIKKLRHEDSILRRIRNRRKALDRWDKLRKYVMYTWGCSTLEDEQNNKKKGSSCSGGMLESISRKGSSHKYRQQSGLDSINLNRKVKSTSISKKIPAPDDSHAYAAKSSIPGTALGLEGKSDSRDEPKPVFGSTKDEKQQCGGSCEENSAQRESFSLSNGIIPLPPTLELKDFSEMDMSDVQKNLKSLYDYNVMLREKFLAVQYMLHELATKSLPPANNDSHNTS
ncbi:Transmembrane protein [Trema orientale]|uniref:Transmembrane protein n=1 Tax=Trema orientale TaxID=63057 RepID=A0A2P5AMZ5_TREOI|nr:Transmembrane protein [Trema orientale]